MSETGLKIFRLNINGSFDEISYENIKDVFTIVNILAIYVPQKKTMYIWIGPNAIQALKIHISNIRVLLKEEFPDFRIIRNFTFEMRDEPYDFFKNLDISKEELYTIIDYQEEVMLPILREVDNLRTKSNNFIESEDYANAIKISEEIIVLANKIEDDAVLAEQKRLLNEIKSKNEEKEIIDEILEGASAIEEEFSNLIEAKEFLKAHQLIEEFEKSFRDKYDLSLIPTIRALILREEKIWKKEQNRLVKVLNKLENDFFLALKNLEVESAIRVLEKGKSMFLNLVNDEIKSKWDGYDVEIQITKEKVKLITKCDDFIGEHAKLKEDFQFNTITTRLIDLLDNVKNLKIADYRKKLEDIQIKVNLAEDSYNKKLAKIAELEKKIKIDQSNNLLDNILENYQNIIKLAISVNKSEIEKKYSSILTQTEEAIEKKRIFEEKQKKLKNELSQIEKEILTFLKNMDVEKVEGLIEKSEIYLAEVVDNALKESWNDINKRVELTRDLIQKVEALSKNGFMALESKSYEDSLKNYDQIVSLIQGYSKQIKVKVS